MIIDCKRCQARGIACGDCAVSAIMGEEREFGPAEIRALTALANVGLVPPLRYRPAMAKASLRAVIGALGLADSVESSPRVH